MHNLAVVSTKAGVGKTSSLSAQSSSLHSRVLKILDSNNFQFFPRLLKSIECQVQI